MDLKFCTVVLGTLLAVGCTSPYVQPNGPDVASLTFKNDAHARIEVKGFKVGSNCSGGVLRLTQNALQPSAQSQINVVPDQPFSFFFSYNVANKYCVMPGTFLPKAGQKYVASFGADGERCYVGMHVITAGGPVREGSFRLRKFTTFEDGAFCE